MPGTYDWITGNSPEKTATAIRDARQIRPACKIAWAAMEPDELCGPDGLDEGVWELDDVDRRNEDEDGIEELIEPEVVTGTLREADR